MNIFETEFVAYLSAKKSGQRKEAMKALKPDPADHLARKMYIESLLETQLNAPCFIVCKTKRIAKAD